MNKQKHRPTNRAKPNTQTQGNQEKGLKKQKQRSREETRDRWTKRNTRPANTQTESNQIVKHKTD